MNWKKAGRITLYVLLGAALIFGALYGYFYYNFKRKYKVDEKKYAHYIGYLDAPTKESGFERCDVKRTFGWYASAATYGPIYKGSKSKFKKYIKENYRQEDTTESGILNLRFIVNCKGEVGNMEINELDENYRASKFSSKPTEQLVDLSSRKENWDVMEVDNEKIDSYMYLIYKIENGNIAEILP